MKISSACKSLAFTCSTLFLFLSAAVHADREELDPRQLDRITAAGGESRPAPNGGAIVGNDSTANLQSTGEVSIGDSAQTDVRALNLVNSGESAVANGVNVFDGRVTEDAELNGARFDVSQQNVITQDQRRLASLPSYERGTNTETLHTDAGSSAGASSSSVFDRVTDLEQTTVSESVTTEGEFQLSGAPTLKVHFDGELGGAAAVYDAEFNAPSAENSAGLVFNGGIDVDVDGGDITLDTGEDLGLVATLNLPEASIDLDAMGCLAMNGDCQVDGTRTTLDEQISDHSTLYTLDESQSSEETWNESSHEIVKAPFSLQDAQAEYIVVDESSIDVSAAYLVHLSGGAQSGLRAMNAVNAAGSAVANGVNVSSHRAGNLNAADGLPYNLSQSNVITHSR